MPETLLKTSPLIQGRSLYDFPQLPISAYFDASLYQAEMNILFEGGPHYLGHELMVPTLNDYHVLKTTGGADYLKRTEDGIKMFSNICRHRQAFMLKERGNARRTLCPLHHWSYDNHGKLNAAPHFDKKPCLHLPETRLTNWQGLLFEDNGRHVSDDLHALKIGKVLDFGGYVYHSTHVDEYEGNWKTFIEVYLEDYHVRPFHPGLGHFVDCDALEWCFGKWCSAQLLGVYHRLGRPGSAAYEAYGDLVKDCYGGDVPAYGATWLTYFPGIMIECYPQMLIISTLQPNSVRRYRNTIEFYYPEKILAQFPDFVEASQNAYLETAQEDMEIIERMEQGRQALWRIGRNEVGPYQHPMESGMEHFHRFLRQQLGSQIGLDG